MTDLTGEPLHTIKEVATIFQVTPWTVREWCKTGKIGAVRLDKGWRIPHSALEKYANERYGEASAR
jgi:excisionase family DNA binding protein